MLLQLRAREMEENGTEPQTSRKQTTRGLWVSITIIQKNKIRAKTKNKGQASQLILTNCSRALHHKGMQTGKTEKTRSLSPV